MKDENGKTSEGIQEHKCHGRKHDNHESVLSFQDPGSHYLENIRVTESNGSSFPVSKGTLSFNRDPSIRAPGTFSLQGLHGLFLGLSHLSH